MANSIGIMAKLKAGGDWTFYPGTPEYAVRGLGNLQEYDIAVVSDTYDLNTLASQTTGAIWTTAVRATISAPAFVDVPPGQNFAWVPVTASNTATHSIYSYVDNVSNVTNGGINVGTVSNWLALNRTVYRWAMGDDLVHYMRLQLPTGTYTAGQSVRFHLSNRGSSNVWTEIIVRFTNGATSVPNMPIQYHRPIYRLNLTGATRSNTFDPANIIATDTGYVGNASSGTPCWRARPAHGHTQDGNGETGVYLNSSFARAMNPISYDSGEQALRLHTEAFPDNNPFVYTNGQSYKQQAVMIQGQRLDNVCGSAGVWRMVAKTSRRRFAWPAFWLIGRSEYGQWPPEIDIMEQFNQVYSNDVPLDGFFTSYAQHYGNSGSGIRVGAYGNDMNINTLLGITQGVHEAYHSYSCAVVYDNVDTRRSKVYFFFDDIEVGEMLLYARHQDMTTRVSFFPMANVAVKTSRIPGYTQAQYNTDDGRGFSGDMLIRDIGYYPSGFTFTSAAAGSIPNATY